MENRFGPLKRRVSTEHEYASVASEKYHIALRHFPNFLIVLGVTNILLEIVIAGIRLLGVQEVLSNADMYNILGIIEPYIKIIWDTLLVVMFVFLIQKEKCAVSRDLMLVWGFITVIIQAIYYISSAYYTEILGMMREILSVHEYTKFYVSTHTYKYVPMFIAIIMGAVITAIILRSKFIFTTTVVICVIYGACYGTGQEFMIAVGQGKYVGVIVSALIYHLVQSVGIMGMGIYIRRTYYGKKASLEKIELC